MAEQFLTDRGIEREAARMAQDILLYGEGKMILTWETADEGIHC